MWRRENWRRLWRRCKRRWSTRRCRMRRTCGWRRFTGGWAKRKRRGKSRSFTTKLRRRRKRRWSGSGGNWGSLWLRGSLSLQVANLVGVELAPPSSLLRSSLRPQRLCVRFILFFSPSQPSRGLGARGWGAHQVDEHFVEFLGVEIDIDFHSLQLPLGLVAFQPCQGVAVRCAVVGVHGHVADVALGDDRRIDPGGSGELVPHEIRAGAAHIELRNITGERRAGLRDFIHHRLG